MKKLIISLIILIVGIFPLLVNAEEYELNTLIPVNTDATVKAEKFDYNNLMYDANSSDFRISFASIKNNSHTSKEVSINVLLFGEDKKNIGLVAYCTSKDLDSDYSGFKIAGDSSAPFSIKMVSKYFVDGKKGSDVKYIAVMDDNKYCHVGGYTNYEGKTIDEIVNNTSKTEATGIRKIIVYIQENNLQTVIILGLLGIAVLVVLIMIIKGIIKRNRNKAITYKPHDDAPIEETVDLNYDNVDLEDNAESNNFNVSMGANTTNENVDKEEPKEEKEEESDLTKFFN